MGTLTAANSVFMIGVLNLFPAPVQLQGFATDDIFNSPSVKPNETLLGVDGRKSSGHVPVITVTEFILQADSGSNILFEQGDAAEQAINDSFEAFGIVSFPGLGRSFTLTNGTLINVTRLPSAGKLLKPRTWGIDWESVVPTPI